MPEEQRPHDVHHLRPGSSHTKNGNGALKEVAGGLLALKNILKADVGFFEAEILYRAGLAGARRYLEDGRTESMASAPKDRILSMLEVYSKGGFGTFVLDEFDEEENIIGLSCPDGFEALAYRDGEKEEKPSCSYTSGFLAEVCHRAFSNEGMGHPELDAVEVECRSQGAEACRFLIGPPALLALRGHKVERTKESISEHTLRLNEEILLKNLDLQNLNMSLEKQVRKRTEELRRSEENYRALTDLSPDPIVLFNLEGRAVLVNETGLSMFNLVDREYRKNLTADDLFEGGRKTFDQLTWTLEKEGSAKGMEMTLLRRGGGTLTGEISARFAHLGTERCVQTIMRDVTEKKALQDQIVEAKEESEFLTDLLSHDMINSMISAIHFSSSLQKSPHLTEEDRKNLAIVTRDIKGAFELAAVVRDVAHAKSIGDSDCETKELVSVLSEAIEESKRTYTERKVLVNFEKSAEEYYALGNSLMSRLFVNLITNAIKFDPKEDVEIDITIDSVTRDGTDYWEVRITDRGRGIPDDLKTKVFDRYYRSDNATPGTGLGLFVVKRLAEVCRGSVWAENAVAGDYRKGTVMVVQLEKVENGRSQQSRRK